MACGGEFPPSARGSSFILPVSFPVPPASLSSGHFESSNQGRPRRDRRTPLGRWVTTLNPFSTKDAHVHLALGPVDHRVCLRKTCRLGAGRPSEPHRPAWLERGRDRKGVNVDVDVDRPDTSSPSAAATAQGAESGHLATFTVQCEPRPVGSQAGGYTVPSPSSISGEDEPELWLWDQSRGAVANAGLRTRNGRIDPMAAPEPQSDLRLRSPGGPFGGSEDRSPL